MSDLPKGWVEPELRACVDVLDSLRIPVNSEDRAKRQGEIPYYGATGQVGWIDEFIFDEELILIGEDGAPFFDKTKPIAYIIKGKSWVNNHAHVLRAISNVTTNQYLKHYFDWFDFHDYVNGTTRLKLTQGSMNQIPVRLAPPNEQRRIVAKLEKLLGKVDACQTRLEKIPTTLKRFRRSVLSAACSGRLTADWRGSDDVDDLPVSWSKVEFGDLMVGTPKNGLYKPQEDYGRGTPILRIDNFYDGYIESLENLKRVDISKTEQEQHKLAVDDIVVNRVNSIKFLGKSALVRYLLEPTVFESNMMRIRIDEEKIGAQYAITYLCSLIGLEELRKNAKHAVNQSSINQSDVKAVLVNLPPLPEQQEIVRRVEELFALADRIEGRYKKAKAHIDKITQSILAKAFRGELVPQDPDDEPASKLLERIKASQMANHGKQKKEAAKPRSAGRKGKQDDENN